MRNNDRLKLTSIFLAGFKSIHPDGETIDFGDITVMLGANGSGKSNLISFFSMLNYMTTGALQTFIGENGSAQSLLYYGAKRTTRIKAKLHFAYPKGDDSYHFSLTHAAGDTLIFAEETICWKPNDSNKTHKITLDPGLKESGLYRETKKSKAISSKIIYKLLRKCQVFQFHDTSKTSKFRNKVYINDNRFLYSDGGNLAAFLYALKNNGKGQKYYQRIVRYIQQIMPHFADFELYPSPLNENYIILNWKEKGSEYLFGPHQISDGSLRFMAMATLLMQPPETMPSVIILDEPELGLHPSAISVLAGMVKAASHHCQVVMATQSQRLVDEFEPENIVVVERNPDKNCSEFKSLDRYKLQEWLAKYSLSELWEKNVLGGQP